MMIVKHVFNIALLGALGLNLVACSEPTPRGAYQTEHEYAVESLGQPLSGKLSGGRYTQKIGQENLGEFSVAVPQAKDPYEFRHMWRFDEVRKGASQAIFGPAALDGTVYRVTVGRKPGASLESFIRQEMPKVIEYAEKYYHQPMMEKMSRPTQVNGRNAEFHFFEQVIPATEGDELLASYNKGVYSHAVYFVDHGDLAAVLWVQGSTGSGVNQVDQITQRDMMRQTWRPQQEFIRSFRVHPRAQG